MEQLLVFFFFAFIIRQLSFVTRYLQSLTFLGHARNSEGHSFLMWPVGYICILTCCNVSLRDNRQFPRCVYASQSCAVDVGHTMKAWP